MGLPAYEVYAIRYAQRRDGLRGKLFLGGDPHDEPMAMDYYVWAIRDGETVYVVDLGFTREVNARRQREYLLSPVEGLALLNIDCSAVRDVIVTHLHFDHAGCFADFPKAQFHLQDDEMSYATGRFMGIKRFGNGFEVEDVVGMVRLNYQQRVSFWDGDAELAPGISVHRIGGHTHGLQCVRVHTARGWVVLASDAAHYYEQLEHELFFQGVFNVGEMAEGFRRLKQLADSPDHIIPGHDPLVMQRYPAPLPELQDIVVRLDVPPTRD